MTAPDGTGLNTNTGAQVSCVSFLFKVCNDLLTRSAGQLWVAEIPKWLAFLQTFYSLYS